MEVDHRTLYYHFQHFIHSAEKLSNNQIRPDQMHKLSQMNHLLITIHLEIHHATQSYQIMSYSKSKMQINTSSLVQTQLLKMNKSSLMRRKYLKGKDIWVEDKRNLYRWVTSLSNRFAAVLAQWSTVEITLRFFYSDHL